METETINQQVDQSPTTDTDTDALSKVKENLRVMVDKLNEIVKVNCVMLDKLKFLFEENSQLMDANDNLYDELYNHKVELTSLDQYGRRENVEFVNIPESITQEQLMKHISEVCKSINIKVTENDVHNLHRIGKKSSRPRNVIVRFVNRKTAFTLLKNKKKLKSTKYKYYITENLCPYNKQIFNRLYKHKKNNEINSLWTYNGNVFIKVTEEDERVHVQHLDDIDDLLKPEDAEEDSDEESVDEAVSSEVLADHPDNAKMDHRRKSRRQSGFLPKRRLSLVEEDDENSSLLRTPIPPLVIQV